MRERVCIVLNEREPNKAKIAELLAHKLEHRNITSSRLKVDKHLEKVVRERKPEILVLDYLLGDYSTGLDILISLGSIDPLNRPKVYFLTDEPSVAVAVQAMRAGALNYYEIDHPHSVELLAVEINDLLNSLPRQRKEPERRVDPSLDQLVASSKSGAELISRAKIIAAKKPPILVICGQSGTGRTTIARAIQKDHKDCMPLTIDLLTFDGQLKETLGLEARDRIGLRLGVDLSLIVENASEDGGELIELITKHYDRIFPGGAEKANEFGLILTTDSTDTVNQWKKLCKAEVLNLPALGDRKEDIAPLANRFLKELESDLKLPNLDSKAITWLTNQDWPGNIQQLRALVVNAALATSASKGDLIEALDQELALWSSANEDFEIDLSPLTVAKALEQFDYNYRLAGAKLGISRARLKALISADA